MCQPSTSIGVLDALTKGEEDGGPDEEEYAITRTTIPTWLESIFILPCNIGYHIEHHWYPSVPFYRLPELHARLLELPRFRDNADISHSILHSLNQVTAR